MKIISDLFVHVFFIIFPYCTKTRWKPDCAAKEKETVFFLLKAMSDVVRKFEISMLPSQVGCLRKEMARFPLNQSNPPNLPSNMSPQHYCLSISPENCFTWKVFLQKFSWNSPEPKKSPNIPSNRSPQHYCLTISPWKIFLLKSVSHEMFMKNFTWKGIMHSKMCNNS